LNLRVFLSRLDVFELCELVGAFWRILVEITFLVKAELVEAGLRLTIGLIVFENFSIQLDLFTLSYLS
jgi:hypothetical protein